MSDPQSTEDLADGYVLGLLSAAEARALEARCDTEPALRAAVAASRDRFIDLDLTAAPAPLNESLWARVEAALDQRPPQKAEPAPPRPANDNARPWRRAAFAGIAASLLLAVALTFSLLDHPEPQVIAVLLDEAGQPVAIVEDFAGPKARLVALRDLSPPKGRSIEVWTKPVDADRPFSLGVLAAGRTARLPGAALGPAMEGQLYEISLEQEGGSPSGLPTGPILGKGFAFAPR